MGEFDSSLQEKELIFVVGYPKSGNTWLARLMGDVLDSPVGALSGAISLAEEGHDRKGDYYIVQMHLTPFYRPDLNDLVSGRLSINTAKWSGEPIILVVRDPRDIVLSAYHYWNLNSIRETMDSVLRGGPPLSGYGGLNYHIASWLIACKINPPVIKYESLHSNPVDVVQGALNRWDIYPPRSRIESAVKRQSFDRRRRQIVEEHGEDSVKAIHMRRGIAGEWRSVFTPDEARVARLYFQGVMDLLGYE